MHLIVYLLPAPHRLPRIHERLIPYFEEPQEGSAAAPTGPPQLGSRVRGKVMAAYRELIGRFPLPERLCTAMIKAQAVEIRYPDTVTEEEARHAFTHFLRLQQSKHRLWTAVDGALAGMGALLMPIPGPNVFFFYPAVRAYSHFRARQGADRARAMTVSLVPDAALGRFREQLQGSRRQDILPHVEELAASLQLPRLPEYFQKDILHKSSAPHAEDEPTESTS